MLAINHNLLAANTANSLNGHYGRLQISTQRLSSGLRINGAADDAAGLAIRELMRSDITALRQGMRNVNDAISMIQTFDGALGVIDEKLIRMKELAEQAATGTYDSTQRLMIDSEFQAMGAEIDRIARATDFNGIKLLDGNFGVGRTQTVPFATVTAVNAGAPDTSNNQSTVTINNSNLSAAKYNGYLPTEPVGPVNASQDVTLTVDSVQRTDTANEVNQANGPHFNYTINISDAGTLTPISVNDVRVRYNNGTWTCQVKATATSNYEDIAFDRYGTSGNGPFARFTDNNMYMVSVTAVSYDSQTLTQADLNDLYKFDKTIGLELRKDDPNYIREYDLDDPVIKMSSSLGTASYASTGTDAGVITARLRNGDSVSINYTGPIEEKETIKFSLDITGQADEKTVPIPDEDSKVKIHFGPMNDSAEDYYYIFKRDVTIKGLGLDGVDIQTQDKAQNALVQITDAMVTKDKVRAEFGAMQNRLENTLTNLSIQQENLQAAESRISDTEVAQEMMNFVRNQILTQSAVAMLTQANSLPQMVMKLIG